MAGVQNCSEPKESQETNCTLRLPYMALRDQEASRAGRHLEGTCALAIRPCNR